MKWLSLVLTYAMGKFGSLTSSPSPLIMIEQLLAKGRYLLMMTTVSLISATLFCAGIILAVINATTQYDDYGSIYWSATLTTALVLAGLSLVSLGITFSVRNWEGKDFLNTKSPKARPHRASSPIEEALTMLVVDFVDERRARRESLRAQPESNPHYPRSNPHTSQQDVVH